MDHENTNVRKHEEIKNPDSTLSNASIRFSSSAPVAAESTGTSPSTTKISQEIRDRRQIRVRYATVSSPAGTETDVTPGR
jgi:hypothetical protein